MTIRNLNDNDEDEMAISFRYNSFDVLTEVIFRDTGDSISECQKRNYDEFISKQELLTPEILREIFKYYKEAYPYYYQGWNSENLLTKEEIEEHLPSPTIAEDLKKYIEPSTVFISNKENCAEGTVGIYFVCTWDIEHGLGVLIKNWKVVQTGTGEIAFLL